MSTTKISARRRGARLMAVGIGIGSLLATAGMTSRASADHTLLEQLSTGPAGRNGAVEPAYVGASADGTKVFFTTLESLVSADTDTVADVYERSGGQTTLVSTGPNGGSGDFIASFMSASADGSRVFFQTRESLVAA